MEKKEWRDRFIKLLYRSGYDYDIPLIEKKVLEHFISQEIDKAREEGRLEGIKGYSSLLKTSANIIERELSKLKDNK